MATGLIALLDDVAAIAKLAAASVDDAIGQAAKAGTKAAGIVIDDAAVTPRYVVGISPKRELPMIWKITLGSLKNKLLFLLPLALALGYFAPWAITPLLMVGGVYLCYEGAEKVLEYVLPHAAHAHEAESTIIPAQSAADIENEKVRGAVRTDFILSAEIMAITLASVPDGGLVQQAIVLALVGIFITIGVYGFVGLIVKADDIGLAMAKNQIGTSAIRDMLAFSGRALVKGMPIFMTILATIGTLAMLWVGGNILIHGLAGLGYSEAEHVIHDWTLMITAPVGTSLSAVAQWAATTFMQGIVGLVVGGLTIPVVGKVLAPFAALIRRKPKTV